MTASSSCADATGSFRGRLAVGPAARKTFESFRNLEETFASTATTSTRSVVIQYNKRDVANVAPLEYMEFLLNGGPVGSRPSRPWRSTATAC